MSPHTERRPLGSTTGFGVKRHTSSTRLCDLTRYDTIFSGMASAIDDLMDVVAVGNRVPVSRFRRCSHGKLEFSVVGCQLSQTNHEGTGQGTD